MADLDDVRRVGRSLPGAVEGTDSFGFGVEVKGKVKGFCWSWLERLEPKKARVENLAVLVRLAAVEPDELRELLTDAWWCTAPKDLRAQLPRE